MLASGPLRRAPLRRPVAALLLGALVLGAGADLGLAADAPPRAPSAPPDAAESTAPAISIDGSKEKDRAIRRRLEQIFSQLEGLEEVRVDVAAGVVTLSGEVISAELHQQALRVARAVEGVVAVEDDLSEVRDVRRRLAPVRDRLVARGYDLLGALPLLGVAALVFLLFALLAFVAGRSQRLYASLAPNPFLSDLLRQVVRAGILFGGFVLALDILDATALVGTVLGAAGIVGLAIGFALRDTVENYIASILLSLRQPFSHGDHVVIEGQEGRVIRLTSRATLLMTLDGNHARIPNATVYKSVILNYTRNPKRRFQFDVGVGTDENLSAVQKLAAETLERMEGVLGDPAPVCTVEALGDSNVAVRVAGWVDQREADFLKVRSEAIRLVKQAFDAAGMLMPEPTYNLRVAEPGAARARAAGPAGAPSGAAPSREPAAASGPSVAVDIAPRDDIDRQIASERRQAGAEDLLDPEAPVE